MAAISKSNADEPLPVKDRVAEFETIFWSSPVYLSGVYPINKSGYLLYYGGTQNPRCIDLANASEADLQALSDACQPATFGLNNTDVYDESYRLARKMDTKDFATKFDPEDCGLLDLIADDFLDCGSDVKSRVICELYKLNVYGKDSFFKAHKDTPRSDTMIGSLVIVFPTPHEGGSLILREKGREWTFDSATRVLKESSPQLGYVVFYSDVEHEVTKVTSGYRVTLTYNLYINAKSTAAAGSLIRQPHLTSRVYHVGQELKSMLADFLARPGFLPSGGYIGFGLRFMYPLDVKTPVATVIGSLKGCDAMLKMICDELGLVNNLHAVYKSSAGEAYERKRVFVVRDTFYQARADKQYDTQRGDLYNIIADKNSLLLRPAGADPVQDYYRRQLRTHEVHWATKMPDTFNTVKSNFMVYGNEAQMTYTYGMPVLLARVKPYAERTKEAGNINTTPGFQKVSSGASDPLKSSQPGDDTKPSAPKASKGKQPEQQRTGDASGGSHTPAVAPAKAAARATDTAPALSREKISALATEKAPALAFKAGAAPSESKINDTLSKTRKTRAGAKASADVATVTNKAATAVANEAATAAVPATPSKAMAGPIKAAASTPAKAVTERRDESSNSAGNNVARTQPAAASQPDVPEPPPNVVEPQPTAEPQPAAPSQLKRRGKRKADVPAQPTRSSKRLKEKKQ
ncbi:hypothetical protein EV121DRAFT_287571 [Schizophyllum commune]